MLQAGPPSLHYYYYAIVLHSCIVLTPVGHSSNHEHHCCKLADTRVVFRNFNPLFNVFISLSLVYSEVHRNASCFCGV